MHLLKFAVLFLFVDICVGHQEKVTIFSVQALIEDSKLDDGWSEWGAWQICSRSCGGGVTYMLRHCNRTRDDGLIGCVGASRQYSSCNIQDCPDGSIDFRTEQCTEFNNQTFSSRSHEWEPYQGASASNLCELNCQPRDGSFFVRLKDKVVDGTRCSPGSFNVCVDGSCQKVGCDMMLGSGLREDNCRVCGGDGSSCYHVDEIFTTPKLPGGYFDIITIPAGATNIQIDEYRSSKNYLAVRNSNGNYVLNGNRKINRSRAFQVAGTTMHYSRKRAHKRAPESLQAAGPTTEPINIAIIFQERNKGIKYSFYLPVGVDDPNSGEYSWRAGQWSNCSKECGRGIQTRRLKCQKDSKFVSPSLCQLSLRPHRKQHCNHDPCQARWKTSNWTDCTQTCNGGIRLRQVFCTETPTARDIAPRLVNTYRCIEDDLSPKPDHQEECNLHSCPGWKIGEWGECSATCNVGQQTRTVECNSSNSCENVKPPDGVKECNLGPCVGIEWVVSEWTECTEQCGKGMQTRIVHCAGENGKVMYPDLVCTLLEKPASHRSCESTSGCTRRNNWITGSWSECSAKCGNGMQTRTVVCAILRGSSYHFLPDATCERNVEKPASMKNCSMSRCQATWFIRKWSTCSVSCGGGIRSRHLMCLSEVTFRPVNVTQCYLSHTPIASEPCNTEDCDLLEVSRTNEVESNANFHSVLRIRQEVTCHETRFGCCPDQETTALGRRGEGCIDTASRNLSEESDATTDCSNTEFGCCDDTVTIATGINKKGCPEHEVCFVEKNSGLLCGDWQPRWHYNIETSKCEHFWFGGCGGNRNNYDSIEECSAVCARTKLHTVMTRSQAKTLSSQTHTTTTLPTTTIATESALQTTTKLTSKTKRYKPKSLYVPRVQKSSQNVANGEPRTSPVVRTEDLVVDTSPAGLQKAAKILLRARPDLCTLSPSVGQCSGRYYRWHYDSLDGVCKSFVFGGCAGNENNFRTMQQCEVTCKKTRHQTSKPTSSPVCEISGIVALFEGRRVPQCNITTGMYRTLQCINNDMHDTLSCWCVDPISGEEIDGSSRKGPVAPDCDQLLREVKTKELDEVPDAKSDCASSEFGCCKDRITPARGLKYLNCPGNRTAVDGNRKSVRIRSSRTSVNVRKHGSARLPCPAVGYPKPTVRWFKDGQEILAGENVVHDNKNHGMIFISVQLSDVGSYICVASNGVGPAQRRTVRLNILENRIQFRTKPSNVRVTIGQQARLKCRVRGGSAAITWLKDGTPLTKTKEVSLNPVRQHYRHFFLHLNIVEDSHYVPKQWGDLRVVDIVPSDHARYTCLAKNSRGERITASARIFVESRYTKPYTTILSTPAVSSTYAPVTKSTFISKSTEQCIDYPKYANCKLVVRARMCNQRRYSKYCCQSCQRSQHRSTESRRKSSRIVDITR